MYDRMIGTILVHIFVEFYLVHLEIVWKYKIKKIIHKILINLKFKISKKLEN